MVAHNEYVDLLLDGKEMAASAWADNADGHRVYAGAKHALCCWMRRQTPDLARQGVRINAVAPGIIDTPLSDRVMVDGDLGAAMRDFAESVPLGQIGKPEQVASVVAFLLSEAASFITGSIVFADGGHDAMMRPDAF